MEVKGTPKTLGGKLRARRIELGLKQTQVAQGICRDSELSLYENDRVDPEWRRLARLCERLQTTPNDLIPGPWNPSVGGLQAEATDPDWQAAWERMADDETGAA